MAITDKMVKNSCLSVKIQPFRTRFYGQMLQKPALSVNPHHNGQKFTDKSLKNGGLSVKCVLLTDKSAKIVSLSVKFERNPGAPPKIRKNSRHHGTNFHHYSVAYGGMSVRLRTLSVKHTLDRTPCNHEDIGIVNGFIGLGLELD